LKKSKDKILEYLIEQCKKQKSKGKKDFVGCTTKEIANALCLQRSNVSSVLNKLYAEGKVLKIKGKPVIYTVNLPENDNKVFKTNFNFDTLIGGNGSLKKSVQQAKAAILYPPNGLHTLLLGPTGVGKTMFAELMYKFAVEKGVLSVNAPFVAFNCADYANNPQLLLAHLFGCKKGAFTGADKDRPGLVDKANGGILFLDEIHRLPPEGQEMLFMLIDKGIYTALGDIDNKKKSDVLIICATTESEGSYLLSTFTRRIPMTINIPSLKERPLEERFELICQFFKTESIRIGKEIIVSANVLRSLLLYNCNGNVGQLKSDIQLGCANAFLKYISKGEKRIIVDTIDFSNEVKQGLLLYKNYSEVIDNIIKEDMKLTFSPREGKYQIELDDNSLPKSFYEDIEKRIQELQERGVDEQDINFIMSFDIENYFKKYIRKFNREVNKHELAKIVDKKIIDLVEDFLMMATERLKRVFPSKVFYGLCLHLSSSIERIKQNKKIVNHNLKEIIEKNSEEYALALHFAGILENEFNIKIPVDEVGFISMFLSVDKNQDENVNIRPIVVVAMHGKSTASSMAEVANKLVGGENVYSYDMSLDKNPQVAYKELKDLIIKKHQGVGVILLVDMGSLGMFGELISAETGIKIKVLDMVTTIIAIECAKKAMTSNNIDEILEEVKDSVNYFSNYGKSLTQTYIPRKENIILTVCTTGEGSAIKLKNLIEEKINLKEKDIQIIPMSVADTKQMHNSINRLSKDKRIIAIVGTINPNIYGIPFISVSDFLLGDNYDKIKNIIDQVKTVKDLYDEIFEALDREFKDFDVNVFKTLCINFLDFVEDELNKDLNIDKAVGLILHLACAISKMIKNEDMPKCSKKEEIKQKYTQEFKCIKTAVVQFEKSYNIVFTDDEICNILSIIKDIYIVE
jgi:transcriptional regulatory protein LevR/transcriptional regulator with AAA-type ATPase domain